MITSSNCTKCAHMTVCQYKEEYMKYVNDMKGVESPSYVRVNISCNHEMSAPDYSKKGI